MLFVPTPPVASVLDIAARLQSANKSDWLLVDRSLVSEDGKACDKVGTSFEAFKFQAAGCNR